MKTWIAIGLVSCFLGTMPALADTPAGPVATTSESTLSPAGTSLFDAASPFRLLDPSRLTMSQSYSLSYYSGRGVGSGSIGLYMNSIGYQIARPLYVQLDLGVMHNPGALWGGNSAVSGAQIRPNFLMRYTPSPGFQLLIDVRTVPMYYGGYGFAGPRFRPGL